MGFFRKKEKIVIALGGNALGNSPEEQLELVKTTAKSIVDLVEGGKQVIIAHGNGPQVGMINSAMDFSSKEGAGTAAMPFPECGSMSQGYIGYHLQQSIQAELKKRDLDIDCATIITQVLVNKNDKGFKNPTKPIGSFMTKEEADQISKKEGHTFVEDAGRGYRRVVASPAPVDIIEKNIIKDLLKNGDIVIAVGGGGIPVIRKRNRLVGVPAVIDKDLSSAKLASLIKADKLLILTAVEKVMINYNQENQQTIDTMNIKEARGYIKDGQFAKGSMLPKVEACLKFVSENKKGVAIISSLEKASDALGGKTGTKITV